jgi:hypothetical protein
MLMSLSTNRFDARKLPVAHNRRMPAKPAASPPAEIAAFVERLDFVRDKTGCPTDSAFAAWIGLKSAQAYRQWKARGSFGSGGRKIHEATGVSTDWLRDGSGVPFPAGQKMWPGPAVADPKRVEALEIALRSIMVGITVARLDVASMIAGALESHRNTHLLGDPNGLLPQLIGEVRRAEAEQQQGKGSLGTPSRG